MPDDRLPALLAAFDPVSLDELDERAALLKRLDHKYAVPWSAFAELAERLRESHQVLEIDGQRTFAYSSAYFDTPDLRCFVDHVEDRLPRFKTRSRLYEDSHHCVFEVKLKRSADETDKRQLDYDEDHHGRMTSEAMECVRRALADAGVDGPDDVSAELGPTLSTAFDRVTFASRRGPERLTCDLGVTLRAPDGATASMKPDVVLVETKSEDGDSPADRELGRMGLETMSLSKYRVGVSLVGGAQASGPQPGSELFN
jgi:VTC domain